MSSVIPFVIATALGGLAVRLYDTRESAVTAAFHRQYHNKWWDRTLMGTYWRGVQTMQTPLDMWVVQEIIHDTRPDVLIETGTRAGGGAFYYASIFDLEGRGRIFTMDIEDYPHKPQHPRIRYMLGSSTSPKVVDALKSEIRREERVMVVLDSLHNKEHVLEEMRLYAPLVTPGNYLVVQDTHLTGHPVSVPFSPDPGHEGPWEAVHEWLPRHPEFTVDRSREKYGLTFNPGGWLRRLDPR
jgi:cephalosporin hydroxylase